MEILKTNKYSCINDLHSLINKKHKITKYKIQKILNENGYTYGVPLTKFPLSEEHKMKRLEFAINHQNFDWRKVIFYDETSFWMSNGKIKRWYNKNDIYDKDVNYKHTAKIQIWGAVSYDMRIIDIFTENMDAAKYVDILKNKLIPKYKNDYHILGDNDPKHNSVKAKRILNKMGVKCINFPACSPDLNPIENIWAIFKSELRKYNYKTINELFESALLVWENIKTESIQSTINSMKYRIPIVIKQQGGYIN